MFRSLVWFSLDYDIGAIGESSDTLLVLLYSIQFQFGLSLAPLSGLGSIP